MSRGYSVFVDLLRVLKVRPDVKNSAFSSQVRGQYCLVIIQVY